jgi:hypothetical protein
MTSDTGRIVFKPPPRKVFIGLALGGALLVGGFMMIGDDSGSLLGYAFSPRVRASQAGWLVLGLGLIVTAAAVVSLWRGCPVLELNENGIVYTRCLQGMTRIDWSDFDHTEIMRTTVPSTSGRDIELEEVVLHTTDDRRVAIPAIAPVSELHDAIARMAQERRAKRAAIDDRP